jgi:hypothetical protein
MATGKLQLRKTIAIAVAVRVSGVVIAFPPVRAAYAALRNAMDRPWYGRAGWAYGGPEAPEAESVIPERVGL